MSYLVGLLSGKKTYLAVAGFVLLAVYSISVGDTAKAAEYALAALGLLGLRSAVN